MASEDWDWEGRGWTAGLTGESTVVTRNSDEEKEHGGQTWRQSVLRDGRRDVVVPGGEPQAVGHAMRVKLAPHDVSRGGV
ncbi:hypothetical protein CTA1_12567 [Colletotrichum tanaceti]|uniref:Uncharacterized protein n=1 Tax=Colletotrichum tanaceti TaxID=1306861 RepID=A0A4U6X619_9PEZI|nr:hypothetical protein CTA1_12567 [Colletotrichum tanaceti]